MAVMPTRGRREADLLPLFADAGRNVLHSAVLLHELLVRWPDADELPAAIVAAEHDGDQIAHEILQRLAEHGSPLDAADVHALACSLDDIVDHAEEAAALLRLYRVDAAMDQAIELAAILVPAAEEVAAALVALGDRNGVAGHLIEIHRLENAADQLVRAAVAELFVDGIDPMAVIRWKDIFDSLEAAIDACETVANVLEGVCLKAGRGPRGHRA
jgi:uncharacterized protein Yka (UPF0111/DUF47 family)